MVQQQEQQAGPKTTIAERLATLTRRESEVLDYIIEGKSNDQIAMELFRSPKTIDKHCQNIYRKTGIHKRVNLVREIIQHRGAADISDRKSETNEALASLVKKSQAWDRLRAFDSAIGRAAGVEYFGTLCKSLASVFGVRMAGICEIDEENEIGTIIACAVDGALITPFQYDMPNTCCGEAYNRGYLELFDHLQTQFGKTDNLLIDQEMEAYVGIKLTDRVFGGIGTLWIANDKPIDATDMPLAILKLYAAPVAAELATQIALDRETEPACSQPE